MTGTSTFGGGIAALNDADALTAWTNAQIGDTLIFNFRSNLPRELNGTPFYGVDIAKWASASGERFQGIWPHQDDPTLPQQPTVVHYPSGGHTTLTARHLP